jgi:LacI family transcriptional regulator
LAIAMPSLRDIARQAQTSVTTVSLVLNGRDGPVRISEGTRRQVLEAARALGYTPNIAARRLRRNGHGDPTLTIGVLLPLDERLTITVRAVGTIRRTLDAWARDEGHGVPDVLIETYPGGRLAEVRSLTSDPRYNGAILFNTLPADDRWLSRGGAVTVPIVLVQRSVDGHSWVNIDNHRLGGEVAAHLVDLGHRRAAVVTSSVPSAAQLARVDGFTARLRQADGSGVRPTDVAQGPFSEAGGYEAARELLRRLQARGDPFPTAVFVTADLMAVGALHALKEAGLRIPADVAVVGYDNDPESPFTDPPLTTVDASLHQSAEQATGMLLALIRDRALGPQTKLLEAGLVVRVSCGATRAEGRRCVDRGVAEVGPRP